MWKQRATQARSAPPAAAAAAAAAAASASQLPPEAPRQSVAIPQVQQRDAFEAGVARVAASGVPSVPGMHSFKSSYGSLLEASNMQGFLGEGMAAESPGMGVFEAIGSLGASLPRSLDAMDMGASWGGR